MGVLHLDLCNLGGSDTEVHLPSAAAAVYGWSADYSDRYHADKIPGPLKAVYGYNSFALFAGRPAKRLDESAASPPRS